MNAIVSQVRESDYAVLAGITMFWTIVCSIAASYTEKDMFFLLIPLFIVVSIGTYACLRILIGMSSAGRPSGRDSVPRNWRRLRTRS
ncbi:MAG: hypothetical protein U0136_09760 [Bdellovibrionota bacterium]